MLQISSSVKTYPQRSSLTDPCPEFNKFNNSTFLNSLYLKYSETLEFPSINIGKERLQLVEILMQEDPLIPVDQEQPRWHSKTLSQKKEKYKKGKERKGSRERREDDWGGPVSYLSCSLLKRRSRGSENFRTTTKVAQLIFSPFWLKLIPHL